MCSEIQTATVRSVSRGVDMTGVGKSDETLGDKGDEIIATSPDHLWHVQAGAASWQPVGQETVVLDLQTSMYLTLNVTASEMWNLLAQDGASRSSLVEHLTTQYDLAAGAAGEEAEAFLEACNARGWIA